jgi:hypothetical protein
VTPQVFVLIQENNDMSKTLKAVLAALVLAGVGPANPCLAVTPEDQVNIESRCRAEAQTYGIAPEQLAEYIDGCILSMGGYLSYPPQDESAEFAAPAEDAPDDDTFAVESMEFEMEPEVPTEYGDETP